MVNFVIIGSEPQVQKALAGANWFLADTSYSDAITKAIEYFDLKHKGKGVALEFGHPDIVAASNP